MRAMVEDDECNVLDINEDDFYNDAARKILSLFPTEAINVMLKVFARVNETESFTMEGLQLKSILGYAKGFRWLVSKALIKSTKSRRDGPFVMTRDGFRTGHVMNQCKNRKLL